MRVSRPGSGRRDRESCGQERKVDNSNPRTKSRLLAILLTVIFGPFGLFYVRPKSALKAVAVLLAVIIVPYGLFWLALEKSMGDLVAISFILIMNLWFAVAAIWIVSIVVAARACRQDERTASSASNPCHE